MASDGTLIFDSKIDDSGFKKDADKISKEGMSLGNKLSKGMSDLGGKVAKKTGQLIKTGIKATTVALTAFTAASIKVGSDFEAGMSQVAATMGMTQQEIQNGSREFEMLSASAREMGAATKFSATEAAEALNYIALAGIDADDAVKLLPKTLNLAAAGGLDLGYTTDLITDSMSALGLSIDEVDGFMDEMARTSQKSNTDIGQLGEAILTVGGTAKDLAGGTVELNTALGILANNGIKGSEGGTKLRNVIMSLTAPTDAAAKALNGLGVEVFDAEGNMRPLNETFEELNLKMADMNVAEKKQWLNTVFNKQDLAAVSALLSSTAVSVDDVALSMDLAGVNVDELGINLTDLASSMGEFSDKQDFVSHAMETWGLTTEQAGLLYDGLMSTLNESGSAWDELQENVENSTGAAAEMSKVMMDNLKGDLTTMKSALEELSISFFETFDTNLRSAVQTATQTIDSLSMAFRGLDLSEMKSNLKEAGVDVDELGVSLVQASYSMEQFDNKADFVASAVEKWGVSEQEASKIFDELSKSMEETGNKSELVAKVITESIHNMVEGLMETLPTLLEVGAKVILSIAQGIANNSSQLTQQAVSLILSLINTFVSNIDKFIKIGADIIKGVAQGLWDSKGEILKHIPQILTAITLAFTAFKGASVGKSLILSIAKGISTNTTPIIVAGSEIVTKLATSIISKKLALSAIGSQLTTAVATGMTSIASSTIGIAAKGIITTLSTKLLAGTGIIAAVGAKIIAVLVAVLSNPIGLAIAAGGLVLIIAKAIFGKKKDVEDATKDTVEGGINDGLEQVEPDTGDVVEKIVEDLKNGTTSIQEAYNQLIEEGFNDNQARETIYASGVELGNEFIEAISTNKDGVRVAFAELRGDGLSELESIDKLIELGVLNSEAFAQGIDDGGEGLSEKYKELRESGLSEADAIAELYSIQGDNMGAIIQATDENLPMIAEKFNQYKETLGSSLEAVELFREKGLLNTEAFGNGSEEGFAKIMEIYQRFSEQGLTTLEILEKFKSIGLLNMGDGGYATGVLEGGMKVDEVYKNLTENGLTALESRDLMKEQGYQNIDAYLESIGERIPEVELSFDELFKSPFETLGSETKDLAKQAGHDTMNSYSEGTTDGSQSVIENANKIRDEALKALEPEPTEVKAKSEKLLNDYNDGFKENGEEIKTTTKEVAENAAKGFETGGENFKSSANKSATEAINEIKSKKGEAESAGREVGKAPATGAESEINKLKDAGTKGGTEFVSGVKSKSADAQVAGKELISSVEKGIQSGQVNTTNSIKKILDQGLKDIKSNVSKYNTQGSELIKELAKGMSSSESEVKSASNKLMQSAQNTIRTATSQFVTIGKEIANGMAQGIRSGSSAVQNAARQVANDAVKAAKTSLGIHSPSRVMAKYVGQPITQGIAQGITDAEYTVVASMNQISDGILERMQRNNEKMDIFELRAMNERNKKLEELQLRHIDTAYQMYQELHKKSIEEVNAEIEKKQDEIEKAKEAKQAEAIQKSLEQEKTALEERKTYLEDYANKFTETYEGIVNEYENAAKKIESTSESIKEKLISYGDVIEQVRDAEGNVIKDEFGNDMLKLSDLDAQIQQVANYGNLLEQLEARGADVDVMSKFLSMSVDDAVKYGKLLMEQSDQDWDNYMRKMQTKRIMAEEISKKYYQGQLDTLNKEYTGKLTENLAEIVGSSEEIGKQSAEALAKGLIENSGTFERAVEDIISRANATLGEELNRISTEANKRVAASARDAEQRMQEINNSYNFYGADYSERQQTYDYANDMEREIRRRGLAW